jgi:glycosyltransferase involved in cell wall biosynthesis
MTRVIPWDFLLGKQQGFERWDGDMTDNSKSGIGPNYPAGPKYSIVIPAFNESARIPAALESVVSCIRTRGWDAEVIVVNDGSTDTTAEVVRAFAQSAPEIRLIENPGNRGKGYSVRAGMLDARGEVALFTDADLSSPITEAERLFAAIDAGASIAIGSRWLESGRQTQRQPLYRQFFGRCFNAVTRAVMRLPFADTQCGLKAFTREAAQTVFQLQTIDRWGFDPEILFIALKRDLRVVEVPVSWAHDERTRMSYLRDGMRMLEEIAQIRWNSLTGRYNRAVDASRRPTP